MSVTVKFRCDSCFKEADGTTFLQRRFITGTSKRWGWGVYETDTVEDVVPEGWVAFDSTIGACYCPECLCLIEAPETDENAPGTG